MGLFASVVVYQVTFSDQLVAQQRTVGDPKQLTIGRTLQPCSALGTVLMTYVWGLFGTL